MCPCSCATFFCGVQVMSAESEEKQAIIDESEVLVCKLIPLAEMYRLEPKEELIQMSAYHQPLHALYAKIYQNLRFKGWTETESIAWLQSKAFDIILGGMYDPLFDNVAQTISNCADKSHIPNAEITRWPEMLPRNPDVFIDISETGDVIAFTNDQQALGQIVVHNQLGIASGSVNEPLSVITPIPATGTADEWIKAYSSTESRIMASLQEFGISWD